MSLSLKDPFAIKITDNVYDSQTVKWKNSPVKDQNTEMKRVILKEHASPKYTGLDFSKVAPSGNSFNDLLLAATAALFDDDEDHPAVSLPTDTDDIKSLQDQPASSYTGDKESMEHSKTSPPDVLLPLAPAASQEDWDLLNDGQPVKMVTMNGSKVSTESKDMTMMFMAEDEDVDEDYSYDYGGNESNNDEDIRQWQHDQEEERPASPSAREEISREISTDNASRRRSIKSGLADSSYSEDSKGTKISVDTRRKNTNTTTNNAIPNSDNYYHSIPKSASAEQRLALRCENEFQGAECAEHLALLRATTSTRTVDSNRRDDYSDQVYRALQDYATQDTDALFERVLREVRKMSIRDMFLKQQ